MLTRVMRSACGSLPRCSLKRPLKWTIQYRADEGSMDKDTVSKTGSQLPDKIILIKEWIDGPTESQTRITEKFVEELLQRLQISVEEKSIKELTKGLEWPCNNSVALEQCFQLFQFWDSYHSVGKDFIARREAERPLSSGGDPKWRLEELAFEWRHGAKPPDSEVIRPFWTHPKTERDEWFKKLEPIRELVLSKLLAPHTV